MATTEEKDPLLEELNGALVRTGAPTEIDAPGDQPPSLDEILETKPLPQAATPKAAALDKTFSKAAGGHGYRVVVEGEYYARGTESKEKVVKTYEIPFNLPGLTNAKGDSALGIIVGKLLTPALRKMDPLAITYRTHTIKSTTPLNGAPEPTSIQYMSFEALSKYVRDNELPLDPSDYWNVEDLREDVIYLKTNAADGGLGAKKKPLEVIAERHAERKEKRELFAMNEGL